MQNPPISPHRRLRPPRRKTIPQQPTRRLAAQDEESEAKPLARLARFKPWLDAVQAILAVIGVFAGYYWFTEQRLNKPNIKIDQTITHRVDAADPSKTLITLDVHATNIGKVKVDLDGGIVELLQINPPPESTTPHPFPLKSMALEPGESDQAIFRTFTLSNTIHTLQVHAQYPVPKSKNYWSLLSAVDIDEKEPKKDESSSVPHS